nr:asparagine synthase-related protein [Sinorhizobium terangae]
MLLPLIVRDHESTGAITEKWLLRKACADLLPESLVWRKMARFDKGSGTVTLQTLTGKTVQIDRVQEGALYEKFLRERFVDSDLVLANAGRWNADRVAG